MPKNSLTLSGALTTTPRTEPLLTGAISIEGAHVAWQTFTPGELFYRQLTRAEFDISEMSLSSLMISAAKGATPWTAMPVFPQRHFFHTRTLVRAGTAVVKPSDLRGRRVGVIEFQQTAAVWSRAALQHSFDVDQRDIIWVTGRSPDLGHGSATGFVPPKGVTIESKPGGQSLGDMLLSRTIDAFLAFPVLPSISLNDEHLTLGDDPRIRTLFSDPIAEQDRYYRETGLYPMNHVIVVRRELLQQHPRLRENIGRAFVQAEAAALHDREVMLKPYLDYGVIENPAQFALSRKPVQYGLEANRRELEALAGYLHEQGLTDHIVDIDKVFVDL